MNKKADRAGRTDSESARLKNPAAVMLGRLGGLKGGPARAERLSPERRREISRNAARVRWGNKPEAA